MKILVVAPFVPWPLAHGGRIRLYNIVQGLAERHDVTLLCLAAEPDMEMGPLVSMCHEVLSVVHRPRFLLSFYHFLFGPNPYNVERFVSPVLAANIRRLLASTCFDIVHLETTHIWPVAVDCGAVPVVLGTQNVESRILAQLQRSCGNPLKRFLYHFETTKMRRFEEDAWRSCRLCLAVSDVERMEIIRSGVPADRVITVPNGVDLERFPFKARHGGRKLLFLGGLDYNPNMDAVRWLLDEIWPLIHQADPTAQLLLAGRNTAKLAETDIFTGVTCLGDPADVPGCFAMADVLLVPLRHGAGTRIKILEAMAAGLPVITTSRGCEGMEVIAGKHLFTANTPQAFAEACLRLISEAGLQDMLARNARKLVEEQYSWGRVTARIEDEYAKLFR